jgi:hypothetical protein
MRELDTQLRLLQTTREALGQQMEQQQDAAAAAAAAARQVGGHDHVLQRRGGSGWGGCMAFFHGLPPQACPAFAV